MIFTWTYVIRADVATYVASYVSYISLYFLLKSNLSYVYKKLDSLSVRTDEGVSQSPMLSIVFLSQVPLISISIFIVMHMFPVFFDIVIFC